MRVAPSELRQILRPLYALVVSAATVSVFFEKLRTKMGEKLVHHGHGLMVVKLPTAMVINLL